MKKLICGLMLSVVALQTYAESVKIFMYHKQPPFVIEAANRDGLIFEVVELLNQQSKSGDTFEVEILPRPRLNAELDGWRNNDCQEKRTACNDDWVVFWVTPQWGWGENAAERFRWVDLFRDSDVLVSNKTNPIDASNLVGHVFGAVRGHKYPPELENPINAGQLVRQDGNNEGAVLERLANRRVDVTMIQQSALDYLYRNDMSVRDLRDDLHVAEFKSFMLQVMLPNTRADLETVIAQAKKSPEWKRLFDKYDIEI